MITGNRTAISDCSTGTCVDITDSGRMKVDALSSVSPEPSSNVIYRISRLLNGSSANMAVNGSVTPVNFDFTPASSETWYLESVSFFLNDNGTTTPGNFGAQSALTNGLQVLVCSNGTEYEIGNAQDNIDLNLLFRTDIFVPGTSGLFETSDLFSGTIKFNTPIRLTNSTSDYVRIKVRDNLSVADFVRGRVTVWRTI